MDVPTVRKLSAWFSGARHATNVPVIVQSEASECGLACLTMILRSHSQRCDLGWLREAFPTSRHGVTLRQLIDIARMAGLAARPLRVELGYVPDLQLPCVLHWELMHYVVLVGIRRDSYIIHDPALGRRVIGQREFSRSFTGIAVEFGAIGAPLQARPSKRLTWGAFFEKARNVRMQLVAAVSFSVLLEALQVIAPFYLQWTVDWVIGPGDRATGDVLLAVFAAILLAQAGATYLRSLALLRFGASAHVTWLTDVFGHALRLPLSFFERRYVADLMGRVESISYIQRYLTSGFFEMLLDGIMSIGLLAMMFAFSSRLAAASCAGLAGALLLRRLLLTKLCESLRAHEIVHSKQQGYFLETIRSVQSVKLFCGEGLRLARWTNLVNQGQNELLRAERIQTVFRLANLLVFGAERLFVIWYASRLVTFHAMSLGMLVMYVMYREMLANRVSCLLDKYIEAKTMEIHLDRLSEIALADPEPEGRIGGIGFPMGASTIELSDVWFRYSDGEPWILSGVSVSITGETTTAITGPSGCGKSTLLKILQGLLSPTRGSVRVNGVPVAEHMHSYRQLIAAVNQSDELFMGTLAENIAFFDAPLDLERVVWSARMAQIDGDIAGMPMRYNTVITDAGAGLSGGQKQRVLLARALYKRPSILFLDEATSHLDTKSEACILSLITQLPMSRVVVAHRPETIAACDRILRMQDGVLV